MGLPGYERPINSFDYDLYLKYLESSKWKELRNKRLKIDDYRCAICGNPHNLQVHHLLYPTVLGTEHIDHLVTLCTQCHKEIENRKKYSVRDSRAQTWYSRGIVWASFSNEEEFQGDKGRILEERCNIKGDGFLVAVETKSDNGASYFYNKDDKRYYMTLVDFRYLSENTNLNLKLKY